MKSGTGSNLQRRLAHPRTLIKWVPVPDFMPARSKRAVRLVILALHSRQAREPRAIPFERLYNDGMSPSDPLILHRRRILDAAAAHGAGSVRVFGSLARGEGRAASDIDLLVTIEDGRSLLDLIALKQEIEAIVERPVDIVTDRALSPYIRQQVLAEARPL